MEGDIFHCRSFSVRQGHAAMKVNTDSVLLGSWTNPPVHTRQVLDIGTGTGILALMLAQRLPLAHILGVEIDPGACQDARENFAGSPWANRLALMEGDVRSCLTSIEGKVMYDLIIANPPFFSPHPGPSVPSRALARHQVALTLSDLVQLAQRVLHLDGQMDIVLPFDQLEWFRKQAEMSGLFVQRQCTVFPRPDRPANRILLSVGKMQLPPIRESLALRNQSGPSYSRVYVELTKDFLLPQVQTDLGEGSETKRG